MSADPQPEVNITGYCRMCGRALTPATMRAAQGTIFCEEHAPAEAAGSPSAPPPDSPYTRPAPPPVPEGASPAAAFLLGLIPGVGAIYNRQYAKGILHVIILALLFMAADSGPGSVTPLFVLSIMGFWFYMAFEAYHTAQNRRRGIPVDEFSSLMPTEGGSRFPIVPVLLIVFGTVFLLDTLEIYEIRRLVRFWPVLMIALGLYMLVARFRSGGPPAGSGRGDGA